MNTQKIYNTSDAGASKALNGHRTTCVPTTLAQITGADFDHVFNEIYSVGWRPVDEGDQKVSFHDWINSNPILGYRFWHQSLLNLGWIAKPVTIEDVVKAYPLGKYILHTTVNPDQAVATHTVALVDGIVWDNLETDPTWRVLNIWRAEPQPNWEVDHG